MNDDSRDPPEPQIFWLCNGVLVLFPCDPEEEPRRAPPGRSDADLAARALVELTPLVLRALLRGGAPERDLPDLAQKVVLDVLPWWTARYPALDPGAEGNLRAYLRVSARRAARGEGRKRRDSPEILECESDRPFERDAPAESPTPEEMLLDAEATRRRDDFLRLENLRRLLDEPQYRAFCGYVFDKRSVKQLAEAENVPVGTIHNRLRLARHRLRAELKRRRAALHAE